MEKRFKETGINVCSGSYFIQLLIRKEHEVEMRRNTIHDQGEIPFWPFLFVGFLPRRNSTYVVFNKILLGKAR
jgi:hypothetical protein